MSTFKKHFVFVFQTPNPSEKIFTEGCLAQGEKWLNDNLIPVAGVVVAVALIQVSVYPTSNKKGLIQAWLVPSADQYVGR